MFSYIRYHLFSQNKELYADIAQEYGNSPIYVYRLAHGRKPKTKKDKEILEKLYKKKIIRIVSSWEKK